MRCGLLVFSIKQKSPSQGKALLFFELIKLPVNYVIKFNKSGTIFNRYRHGNKNTLDSIINSKDISYAKGAPAIISALANSSNLAKLALNFWASSTAFMSYNAGSSHVFLGFNISLGTFGQV